MATTPPNTTTVTTKTTVTTTTTQIVAAGTPAPATTQQSTEQAYITSLQALIAAASADLASPALTRAQAAATRAVLDYAQSALAAERQPTGAQPLVYICTEADSILPILAQRFLGDPLRYTDIQALNSLRFISLTAGQQLLIPAA